jgi:hypothetical protein
MNLTPGEIRLIQAYRQLCDQTQGMIYATVDICSKNPLQRRPELQRPTFRLIAGGAQ